MEKEFFDLIKDPEFCRKAEEKSLAREITIMKMTDISNAQRAAKARGDDDEVARLQIDVDKIMIELQRLR